jgi:hypothetical protein
VWYIWWKNVDNVGHLLGKKEMQENSSNTTYEFGMKVVQMHVLA